MVTTQAATPLRFGRFELQPNERRLLADGQDVPLGARAFDLLLALAERPGRLVSKRALMEFVWPGLVVQDNNLAAQMSALRKALGDQVVVTIPGRGYRLVAPVTTVGAAPVDAATPPAAGAGAGAASPLLRLPTRLPAELQPLLGRDDDLSSLAALLDRHRLVSVVGVGGMGKSLLVAHLLERLPHLRPQLCPQGVCWVELTPMADAAALPAAVAAALGVQIGGGEPLQALCSTVAPLAMVLALDNAEHLSADVARLCRALLRAAPRLRLLVTSQVPLKLAAEQVYRLGPLAAPPQAVSAAQAMDFPAVELFVERERATGLPFGLSDDNASTVAALCRALDGVPLAIELAAARAPLLGVQQLRAALGERLALLGPSRNRHAPARQQTLLAAMQWSHDLLPLREQTVFRRLAVMPCSAALGFIQEVVAASDHGDELDAWAVLDALDALVDRSLVALVMADAAEPPRYRLLETARLFAQRQLDASGERAALQRRHALAVASRADMEYLELFGGTIGVDAWLRRMALEFDHARDALAWARAAGDQGVELTVAATLLRALPPSLHAERMALADAVEPHIGPDLPPALQQRAWLELSCALADTRKPRSLEAAERALSLARALLPDAAHRSEARGDAGFVLYLALCRMASAMAQSGDVAGARAPLAEALALEDTAWPAQRLLWAAEAALAVARLGGETAQALQIGRHLVKLDRERGSDGSIALGNLIDHELAAGDAAAAARNGAALVAALSGSRHEYSLAFARINLCAALLAQGEVAQAREVLSAAWAPAIAFDLPHVVAAYLAQLAALEQRPTAAAQLLGCAEHGYQVRAEAVEGNEAAAMACSRALAAAALGNAAFRRAHAAGKRLRGQRIGELGLGRDDDALATGAQ